MKKTDTTYYFDKSFLEALYTEDLLGAVVRTHLYVENALINLISTGLAFPEEFDFSRLQFPQKLNLAQAMGLLLPHEIPAYKMLNTLRNKLAHRIDYVVKESDVNDLINSLGKPHKQSFDHSKKEGDSFFDYLRLILALLYSDLEVRKKLYEKIETVAAIRNSKKDLRKAVLEHMKL